jgi:hypothetical protein
MNYKEADARAALEAVREERDAAIRQLEVVVAAYSRRLERRDVQVKGLVEGVETAWARIDTQGELIDDLEATLEEYRG